MAQSDPEMYSARSEFVQWNSIGAIIKFGVERPM